MKPNWKDAPDWCTHWLELEGNRELWVDKEYSCVKINQRDDSEVLVCPEVEMCKEFWELRVLQCIPRPQWETLVHYKENGEHRTLKTEGWWTHSAIKRELGVDNNFRFVLEYVKLN